MLGLGLQIKTHAKQKAVKHPELALKKNMFEVPHESIYRVCPGNAVGAKTENIHQQNAEQRHATQNIQKFDPPLTLGVGSQNSTSHS